MLVGLFLVEAVVARLQIGPGALAGEISLLEDNDGAGQATDARPRTAQINGAFDIPVGETFEMIREGVVGPERMAADGPRDQGAGHPAQQPGQAGRHGGPEQGLLADRMQQPFAGGDDEVQLQRRQGAQQRGAQRTPDQNRMASERDVPRVTGDGGNPYAPPTGLWRDLRLKRRW